MDEGASSPCRRNEMASGTSKTHGLFTLVKTLFEILLQYLAAIIQGSSRKLFGFGYFTLWCFNGRRQKRN
jgi:hypothetical protein